MWRAAIEACFYGHLFYGVCAVAQVFETHGATCAAGQRLAGRHDVHRHGPVLQLPV